MEVISIAKASTLLDISRQRIQQLIWANRVRGAYKTKKGWRIPLYKGMPQIIRGKRGKKGTWRIYRREVPTIIHVNTGIISSNHDKDVKDPVIIVRRGTKKVTYCSEVSFIGKCRVIYEPNKPNKYAGATVWIEVAPDVELNLNTLPVILEKKIE